MVGVNEIVFSPEEVRRILSLHISRELLSSHRVTKVSYMKNKRLRVVIEPPAPLPSAINTSRTPDLKESA